MPRNDSQTDEERAPLLGDDEERRSRSCRDILDAKGPLSSFEKALIGLSFALLVVASVFAGLYAAQSAQRSTPSPEPSAPPSQPSSAPIPVPSQPPNRNDEVCLTPRCVQIAAQILDSMDQTVDPCDDFYSYANGGWLKSHPIPEEAGLFGIAQWIDSQNNILLHDIITQKPDDSLSEDDRLNLQHMRSFYDSCLDQDALDRRGSQPLLDIISEVIKLYRGREKKQKHDFRSRLTDAALFLHSRAVPVLFDIALESDVKLDPSTMLIWLQQPELGLPDPAYFDDAKAVKVYSEVIRSSLKSVYESLDERTIDRTPFDELAQEVVAFEKRLAGALLSGVDAEDPNLTYNPHDSAQLQELASIVDWRSFFSGFSPRPRLPDPVIVAQPSYIGNMSRLVSVTDDSTVEAYFVWRAVQAYASLLGSKETTKKEVARLNGYLTGVEEGVRTSSESSCLASLIENAGNLVGRFYIQHAFSERAKEYGLEIIDAVIQAFKQTLPELDWLDPQTRTAAEKKADAIISRIGYPTSPNVTDAAAIRRFYNLNEPFDGHDYFGNVMRARMAGLRRLFNNVGGPRDLGKWNDVPSTVNAEYAPESNTISIPAGDMQTPYFDPDWPEYAAFGAFGSVAAGHELTQCVSPSCDLTHTALLTPPDDCTTSAASWTTGGATARRPSSTSSGNA